jgi:hypothetical protein
MAEFIHLLYVDDKPLDREWVEWQAQQFSERSGIDYHLTVTEPETSLGRERATGAASWRNSIWVTTLKLCATPSGTALLNSLFLNPGFWRYKIISFDLVGQTSTEPRRYPTIKSVSH